MQGTHSFSLFRFINPIQHRRYVTQVCLHSYWLGYKLRGSSVNWYPAHGYVGSIEIIHICRGALRQMKNVVCSLKDLETTCTVDCIKHDCFQKLLIKESSLWNVDPSSNVMHLVREMARDIRLVLERQYTVHFEKTDSELTDYDAKTGTARPNNMICKRPLVCSLAYRGGHRMHQFLTYHPS